MDNLKDFITKLLDVFSDDTHIGGFFNNQLAIAVTPGIIPTMRHPGIRMLVNRVPDSLLGANENLSGGVTYSNDYFLVELVNLKDFPYENPSEYDDMRQVIQKLEANFVTTGRRYFQPTNESYERCLIRVFSPQILTR